jgi:hypothetical protein
VPLAGAPAEALVELERVLLRQLRERPDAERAEIAERGRADVGEV